MSQAQKQTPPAQTPSAQQQVVVATADIGVLEVLTVGIDATQATVQLQGEMDLANADLVTAVLNDQLALGRHFVRLDLSELGFLDCVGVRALVHANNRFLAAGGTLVLTGVGPQVARLLTITGLDEALFIADGDLADRIGCGTPRPSPVPRSGDRAQPDPRSDVARPTRSNAVELVVEV